MGARAADFRFFTLTPDTTVEDVNGQYQRLVRRMHPDRGGSHEEFVGMQREFEEALRYVATRGKRAAQREQAAAVLAMVVEQVVRDPSIVTTLVRRVRSGEASDSLRTLAQKYGFMLVGDFMRSLTHADGEEERK